MTSFMALDQIIDLESDGRGNSLPVTDRPTTGAKALAASGEGGSLSPAYRPKRR
jgi:hypothetical protein